MYTKAFFIAGIVIHCMTGISYAQMVSEGECAEEIVRVTRILSQQKKGLEAENRRLREQNLDLQNQRQYQYQNRRRLQEWNQDLNTLDNSLRTLDRMFDGR